MTDALRSLSADGRLLLFTRALRMFAFGFLSVMLALYLHTVGFDEVGIGVVLSLTLVGDAVIALAISIGADRWGRRRTLSLSAWLMILAGVMLALTTEPALIIAAALIGTLSPTGNEVGPFLAIEQAILPQTIPAEQRTSTFAWYNLIGSLATASGALIAGWLASVLQGAGLPALDGYRVMFACYAGLGGGLWLLFRLLSPAIETKALTLQGRFGLHRSRGVVYRLAALFMLDAFGGGLVVQSVIAYWFYLRFGVDAVTLGALFFAANLLAGLSALAAGRLAARIGLINTMVWTHIPSNVLLMLVPLMPTLPLAVGVLLARFAISQMDVPTRQSYTMAVVDPDERSAAAGITTLARTAASAAAPALGGFMFGALPFLLAGALKITYDLALYRSFRALKPPEEQVNGRTA